MKRIIYCIFLICLIPNLSWAQESDEDEEYQTEFMYGINFNTNGGLIGGIVLRYSTVIDSKMKQTFGLEIVNVKHPKEIRSTSANNGNTYIYGKSNYLFSIRPQYGRELLLFRKAPEEGVRISAIGAIGPSFGIVKPYYVAIADRSGNVTIEQFDPIKHSQQDILGSAAFTRLDGTKIAMGIHAKAGLSFEIGGFRSSATGFEVGAMMEAYTKKIIIVPDAENRSIFTSVYLNIFFKSKR